VLLIVVERAAAEGVHVGVREYFRVGLPVTAATLVLACGCRSPRHKGCRTTSQVTATVPVVC